MKRRTALKTTIAVVSLPTIAGAASAASTRTVPDDYSTIQGAVDAADLGDTVVVAGGTYREQVVVNKDLVLRGEDATIAHPDSAASFTIPESGPNWEPTVFAYGGSESGGAVSGSGTVDVSISGFEIDGRDRQPAARRKPAILLRNVSAPDKVRIEQNEIYNVGVGGKATFGILAYGDTHAVIRNNDVKEYERGGIAANGDGNQHPAPAVQIRDNTVAGGGALGEAWASNGIQVGFGASGTVMGNTVSNNRYSDEGPVASGILVFESDDVVVRQNTVENADVGLSIGSWGWFNDSTHNTKVMENTVSDSEYGVLLEAVAEPYGGALTSMDPAVDNTKVNRNDLTGGDPVGSDPEGELGIGIIVDDNGSTAFEPRARNNKVRKNSIENFATEFSDEGTATKIGPAKP